MRYHALSIKQPWAALLVAGRKTIEVRRWSTGFRGELLIHAARVPDDRPQAWAQLPPDLREAARLGGGIVGVGRLEACKPYRTREAFLADQASHLNDPSWFEPAGLTGLVFTELRALPFRRVPGNVKIFGVDLDDLLVPPAAPVAAPPPAEEPTRGPLSAVLRRIRRLARALGAPGGPTE